MNVRRHVTEAEVRSSPHAVWNAFIDLLAVEDSANLDVKQRQAQLVFWYDSEVQNGGHFQFFENRGTDAVPETIDALKALGAEQHANVLSQAHSLASKRQWGTISSAEEFVEEALESGLADFDSAYHACKPTVDEILESHLRGNRDLYVEVSDTALQGS